MAVLLYCYLVLTTDLHVCCLESTAYETAGRFNYSSMLVCYYSRVAVYMLYSFLKIVRFKY